MITNQVQRNLNLFRVFRFVLRCMQVQCHTCFNVISSRIPKALTAKTKGSDGHVVDNNKLYSCDYWILYTWRRGKVILRFYRTFCQFIFFQDTVGMQHLTSRNPEVTHYLTPIPLDKMAAISQRACSNGCSWMQIFQLQIKFHWNMFPVV